MTPLIRKAISTVILVAFIATFIQSPAYAQSVGTPTPWMPTPGTRVELSSGFTPAHLKGMVIHPDNALQFDFIMHRGDELMNEDQKKAEYNKLIKYFLASLAVPDENQWVNLSPYEKDRIVKDDFGKTEMGRDLLAQDYILKQITASLIYPESSLGQKFWDKVYTQAQQQFGTTTVPVNTFNKVWIVPDEAYIYEKDNTVYIVKQHLKVMLEEDYLSLDKHSGITSKKTGQADEVNKIGSQVVRDIVLPALEKEVNEGKNFAMLRQVYSGMLLAAWYKRALKESLLGKIYADKSKVKGIDQDPKSNQEIYQQYLKAFKKGVFNYIKEDVDRYTKEAIPRKYFSGGARAIAADWAQVVKKADPAQVAADPAMVEGKLDSAMANLVADEPASAAMTADAAMTTPYSEWESRVKDALSGDEETIAEVTKMQNIDNLMALAKSDPRLISIYQAWEQEKQDRPSDRVKKEGEPINTVPLLQDFIAGKATYYKSQPGAPITLFDYLMDSLRRAQVDTETNIPLNENNLKYFPTNATFIDRNGQIISPTTINDIATRNEYRILKIVGPFRDLGIYIVNFANPAMTATTTKNEAAQAVVVKVLGQHSTITFSFLKRDPVNDYDTIEREAIRILTGHIQAIINQLGFNGELAVEDVLPYFKKPTLISDTPALDPALARDHSEYLFEVSAANPAMTATPALVRENLDLDEPENQITSVEKLRVLFASNQENIALVVGVLYSNGYRLIEATADEAKTAQNKFKIASYADKFYKIVPLTNPIAFSETDLNTAVVALPAIIDVVVDFLGAYTRNLGKLEAFLSRFALELKQRDFDGEQVFSLQSGKLQTPTTRNLFRIQQISTRTVNFPANSLEGQLHQAFLRKIAWVDNDAAMTSTEFLTQIDEVVGGLDRTLRTQFLDTLTQKVYLWVNGEALGDFPAAIQREIDQTRKGIGIGESRTDLVARIERVRDNITQLTLTRDNILSQLSSNIAGALARPMTLVNQSLDRYLSAEMVPYLKSLVDQMETMKVGDDAHIDVDGKLANAQEQIRLLIEQYAPREQGLLGKIGNLPKTTITLVVGLAAALFYIYSYFNDETTRNDFYSIQTDVRLAAKEKLLEPLLTSSNLEKLSRIWKNPELKRMILMNLANSYFDKRFYDGSLPLDDMDALKENFLRNMQRVEGLLKGNSPREDLEVWMNALDHFYPTKSINKQSPQPFPNERKTPDNKRANGPGEWAAEQDDTANEAGNAAMLGKINMAVVALISLANIASADVDKQVDLPKADKPGAVTYTIPVTDLKSVSNTPENRALLELAIISPKVPKIIQDELIKRLRRMNEEAKKRNETVTDQKALDNLKAAKDNDQRVKFNFNLSSGKVKVRVQEPKILTGSIVELLKKPVTKDVPIDLIKDKAMSPTGGIDLNSANLNMIIKRDGKGVPLPFSQQDMNQLNRIEGLVPVILEIKPALSLPMFSELQDKFKPAPVVTG